MIACRPQDIWAPFASAAPKAVASETIITERNRLARKLGPRAAFIGASFDEAVVDGFIDTASTFARGTACPLKRAWDVAVGGKEPPDPRAWAHLFYDARPRYQGGIRVPKWTVVTRKMMMTVDASTCVLRE